MAITATTFFKPSAPLASETILNAKGEAIFQLLALGFVDKLLPQALYQQQELLTNLFKTYYHFFPLEQGRERNLLTLNQRLGKIAAQPQELQTFLSRLSYTLRQTALSEWVSNPSFYSIAILAAAKDHSTIAELRHPGSKLDSTAGIAAVAKIMGWPIDVLVVNSLHGEELHLRQTHEPLVKKPGVTPLTLHFDEGQKEYSLLLQNEKLAPCARLLMQTAEVLLPLQTSEMNEPSLSELVTTLRAENQLLTQTFDEIFIRLSYKAKDENWSLKQLMTIYTTLLATSSLEKNKKLGLEYGSQNFLASLHENQLGAKKPEKAVDKNYQQQVMKQLLEAISCLILLNPLEAEHIFEEDKKTSPMQNR